LVNATWFEIRYSPNIPVGCSVHGPSFRTFRAGGLLAGAPAELFFLPFFFYLVVISPLGATSARAVSLSKTAVSF